jgi:GTP pyrophosphokinase
MSTLTPRYEEALVYAVQKHATQVRKATSIPYAAHLLAVSSIVLEQGGNEDEAIAALLHDAIEDQGGVKTGDEIRAKFGDEVHAIVVGCTDADVTPKPPWRERKEHYIAHVAHAAEAVKLVSAADKLHNARSIVADFRAMGDALWERFKGGKEGTLWYYRALVRAYREGQPSERVSRLVSELDRVVAEMERLAR